VTAPPFRKDNTMRRPAILLLLASFVVPALAQQETQLLIPINTADGKRANVTASDLTITEGGQPVKILKIEPKDSPVRVTLALENSRGLSQDFVQVRNGAKAFVNALPANVEVTLWSTAPVARTAVKATTDRAVLIKGIDSLSPDSGPGRFIESLVDWVRSVDKDKDKGNYTPVLVTVGSTFGEESVREDDVKSAMNKLPALGAKVHGIIYNAKTNQGGSADAQLSIGQVATERTGGKWEVVATPQRIAAALPELGAEIAKLQTGGQFLLTVQRPTDAPRLGAISVSTPPGVTIGKITLVQPKK
jgi:hypothetical protein